MKKNIFIFFLLLLTSIGYSQSIKKASVTPTPMVAPPDGGGTGTKYTWYEDYDEDSFGNPAITILSSTKPFGFVSNKTDLDDNNPYITNIPPTQYFYQDADGDTFGNPNSAVFYSKKPPGYVTNNNDCNDADGTLNPNTVWYRDADSDGYGNNGITAIQCAQPAGYVRNGADYNDATANINNIAPRTFYRDADGDGFGNPTVSVYYSNQPAGYVTNNSDYNDGTPNITNIAPQTFYRDADGDGFGNPSVTVYYSVKPAGYVTNNSDCNDGDITTNPNTVWYSDNDRDGFGAGSGGTTVLSCTQPAGYARNAQDCNDYDSELNPNTVWYSDNDRDGFGTVSELVGCAAPPNHNYVLKGGDCDDNNININPLTMWYRDGDGDGFGSSTNFTKSCTQPAGYVRESGDCDDGNRFIKPNTIWYYDNDGDGHGSGSQTKQSCTKPEKYVDKADDCNDYDVTVYTVKLWYFDKDGDTFGDPANSISSCDQPYKYVLNKSDLDDNNPYMTNIAPTQYFYQDIDNDTFGNPNSAVFYSIKPPGYVTNNLDCNDNNGAIKPTTVWYRDGDHDGFGTGSITTTGCIQPTDYVLNASDYDDTTANITNIAPQIFYRDADGDTFGSPNVTVYYSVRPAGYVTNNSDCNDGDITTNPNTVWYSDNDRDGFGAGSGGTTVLSCTQPAGYARNAEDCNDYDSELNPNTVWYHDTDGDGFGTVSELVGCAVPPNHNYVLKGGDCNDNDVTVNPGVIWYRDADGDGFGVSTNFIKSCTQPVGYARQSADCDDGNKLIRPDTTWYYDNDGDGHGSASQTLQSCTKPEKYVNKSDDCNDYDVTVYAVQRWYYDEDGDSFGDAANSFSSCDQPYKHVLNNSDYNDTTVNITNIAPQTFYQDADGDSFGNPNVSVYYSVKPAGYVTNNSDYNDTTVNITNIAPQTFYQDADGDSFGNPNVSLYYSAKPAGYVTNNSDYNDTTVNITNIAPQTFYKDIDGDGFGNSNVTVYYSIQPTGYVANNTDCDDANGQLNPNTKWYADNDLDQLGDPASFVQQCTQPPGNYVANYSDNCPTIAGTSPDCGSLASPSSDYNYVITTTYKEPTETILQNPAPEKALVNITYFDGLGRPVQQIANKQSTEGKDIITSIGYDDFGRQTKEYLPYAAASSNMAYDLNAVTNAIGFYSNEKYENTANPFSEKKLESSPLGRVIKQAAPGTDWAMDSGHEIKMAYQTNTDSEVKLYRATANWNAGAGVFDIALSEDGTYAANELIKTVTFDENSSANPTESGGSTVEFKNKEGKIILKRTYESGTKHDTHYVYDTYGNLTYVISPKADGAINQEVLDGLCYQYKHDYRNRLVERKLPGKQWEFIVYDKLDRPVATGPANSPFKDDTAVGWLITKYDAFGRPIYTGWSNSTANASSRTTLQNAQNTATVLFETKQTSGTIDGIQAFYTNAVAPTNIKLLTVNYYDNYAFPNVGTVPTTIQGQPVLANAKGLATGSWTRALGLASAISGETTSTFYDSKARPIGSYSQNHLDGYTNTDSKLDFGGKPLYTITKHKPMSGSTELVVKEEFTYSPQDRLLTHTHQINGGAIQLLADNTYDKLGQLTSKKVGNNSGMPLQKVDYSYNIRGWMTKINDVANLQQNTDPKDWFAFAINYNKPTTNASVKPLYNGNIAETFWRSNSDGTFRSYGYQYDDLNRLKKAIYQKPGENIPVSGAYNESLSYDKNGNILSLQRFGGSDTPSIIFQIDDLTYDYSNANSNQLTKVTDGSMGNDNQGFIDGNKTGDDYNYDANGNMITDKNKNITGIVYNHLNLPTKITFGTGNSIAYIYNAAGLKLEKKVTDNGIITQTKYLGGYQYKDNVLQFFPTVEGYVEPNGSSFKYVYQYKDHLGNVRLSYEDANGDGTITSSEIIEESHYYPFGLKHSGYNAVVTSTNPAQKYKFQGQERQDELGLNWDSFKWRNYDYAIGRFMSIDPLAEEYAYNSTYAFAENKIGMGRELEGCELGPLFGVAEIVKVGVEIGAKTSEVVGKTSEVAGKATEGSGRFTESQIKDFARGNASEAEQLSKNGLEKNTKPFKATDPKTGKEGTTIPDAMKPDGGTVEVKNVKSQSLTEQLRLQKSISEGNGVKPELIINQSAKISKPLQKAGFDIKTYNVSGTAIDNTAVPKPKTMTPVYSMDKDPTIH
ncbi:DUF6443 domain-containing protein [Flavobacterium aestivum]|uniref:DUF6443 domain-containing protein n=1 Tax=Flavobacterium aestivum TaxID=3003257 RepID=UPI002482ADEF|nr:DUF6443 domain-containing protein [Flavobacterium aestivum]